MNEPVTQLHLHISDVLTDLEDHFTDDVELTLLARHRTNPRAHILVSNDSLAAIRRGLDELEANTDKVVRPPLPTEEPRR